MKINTQVAMPACRVLFTSSGCRVMMAAMPPTNAYTAQTNASRSVNEPNTSIVLPPLPEDLRLVRYMLLRWVVPAGVGLSPPGAASYLEAHLACTCSATKRPSEPGCPSTTACDLSLNVSGNGSLPT